MGFLDTFLMAGIYFCEIKKIHGVSKNVAPLCSASLRVAAVLGRFRDTRANENTHSLIAPYYKSPLRPFSS